ncbi:hypothetical protein [Roseofilum casamattae]|uniref:Uncharacterized protein n=1 Tax=Roseofilum casamattae BLCC-M143 TaxID=3022442 RepID=A0ABT7C494_9CYAN|nr:hypothetical protein [Roseofilum casamattae]MDJ1185719.1 hypothetical protein [Roseofilum casamattae BLCC-M143]
MLQAIAFLHQILQALQPLLRPLCLVVAWTLIIALGWNLGSALRDTLARAKQMHCIPCAYCQFFTNDRRLKCTVHPRIASSELAIDCRDYQPNAAKPS